MSWTWQSQHTAHVGRDNTLRMPTGTRVQHRGLNLQSQQGLNKGLTSFHNKD